MTKMMLAVLTATTLLFAACADPPTESVEFGIKTVGKSAHARLKDNRGMKVKDACQAEVDALPKDQLAKYNRDDVVKGCVQYNTSDD